VRKIVVAAFVVLGMLWQTMALAGQGMGQGALGDAGHSVLHWQSAAHHHHDDGGYHEDDSSDSTQHMVLDGALAVPGLCAGVEVLVFLPWALSPAALDDSPPASAFVDRLRRPPKLSL
jgi:hypothetical protein